MRAFVPELTRLPRRRVLMITSVGSPEKIAQRCVNVLFGTAYGTKFKVFRVRNRDMSVGPLSCRWMNAMRAPRNKWEARWGLQVPAFVHQRDLAQADPKLKVRVADWEYGLVAQVLHRGPYAEEWPSIEKLHAFVVERGYRIVGPHEEEYLTRPDVKVPKTIIRYRVAKAAARAASPRSGRRRRRRRPAAGAAALDARCPPASIRRARSPVPGGRGDPPFSWGCSSAGRAPRSQRGGRRFESAHLHHLLGQAQRSPNL